MIPDYNRDGKIDKYDKEMDAIFMEEDEQICRKSQKCDNKTGEGWALVIVVVIMAWLAYKFGIR